MSPSRSRAYSAATGSFTFSTMSAPPRPRPPRRSRRRRGSYAVSGNALPRPASCSTAPGVPRLISSSAPAGVSATRYSSDLISRATPTLIGRKPTAHDRAPQTDRNDAMELVPLLIATPVEPELVARLRGRGDGRDVRFEPDLLPPPRFPLDHRGALGFEPPPAGAERFRRLVDRREVLYGIPGDTPEGIALAICTAPGLPLPQATPSGAGERCGRRTRRPRARPVAIASASGVHVVPLVEWSLLGARLHAGPPTA